MQKEEEKSCFVNERYKHGTINWDEWKNVTVLFAFHTKHSYFYENNREKKEVHAFMLLKALRLFWNLKIAYNSGSVVIVVAFCMQLFVSIA